MTNSRKKKLRAETWKAKKLAAWDGRYPLPKALLDAGSGKPS